MKKLFLALTLVCSTAAADPVGGKQTDEDLLRAGQTVSYTLALRGGEETLFTLRGDGDGDIDCCVFDESGNRVACDTDTTDICQIYVYPRWTGVFYFQAQNNGTSASYYTFVVH